jgi:hypothetical protein
MGVNTALYKSLTFGVSAMYTRIAGALGALLSAFVSPDSFPVFLSIKFLVGSVVGGIVSILGCLHQGAFHRVRAQCRESDIKGGARSHFRHISDSRIESEENQWLPLLVSDLQNPLEFL